MMPLEWDSPGLKPGGSIWMEGGGSVHLERRGFSPGGNDHQLISAACT